MYGIGPYGLALRLGITQEEAQELMDGFFTAFPTIPRWKHKETMQLLRQGYVTTYSGRRRSPVLIQEPPKVTAKPRTEEWERQNLELDLWKLELEYAMDKSHFDEDTDVNAVEDRAVRQGINFEIQGSIAEVINAGMYDILKAGYVLEAQIHDEVVVEVEDNDGAKDNLEKFLRGVFERRIEGVQFKLDIHFGTTWACGK